MNQLNLNSHVKSYYHSQQLSADKLSQLITLAEASADEASRAKQSRRWFLQRNIAIAATLLICLISIAQFMQPNDLSPDRLALLVSKEIALNHNKRLAPEFIAEDYAVLTAKMDKLDFNLISSNRISSIDLKLVGARYCSIHGQLATQLKLIDEAGNLQTLYQTQLNAELSQLQENQYLVDGVQVTQWQEAGLFFAIAESP